MASFQRDEKHRVLVDREGFSRVRPHLPPETRLQVNRQALRARREEDLAGDPGTRWME